MKLTGKTIGGLAAALSLLTILLPWQSALATNASPHPFTVEQPDGTRIVLYVRGNPHYRWREDINGYTVLKSNDRFVYAQRGVFGRLLPTELEVGKADPRALGLQKRIKPFAAHRHADGAAGPHGEQGAAAPTASQSSLASGTLKNLVVLMRFSDHVGRTLPSISALDSLFNATSFDSTNAPAPAGSLRMVYQQNSYGALTIDSTVYAWVTLPNTEAYYANNNSGLTTRTHEAIRAALDLVDPGVNFSAFDQDGDGYIDAITFLHSGYGAEWNGASDRIWSHKWSLSNGWWTSDEGVRVDPYHISPALWGTSGSQIGRVGVIAHETGHFLGLPDLYDTDSGEGDGIGSWGLMANSWGFNGDQRCIPHFSAWSKIVLGWSTPSVISATGSYQLNQVQFNNEIYRIDYNYPSNEYLLLENRQPAGTESCMPQGGIVAYHIDDSAGYNTQGYPGQSGWPGNGNHYRVAILQADGDYDLERGNNRGDSGDAYHAGSQLTALDGATVPGTDAYQSGNVYATGNAISNFSSAGGTMSFDYSNGAGPPADPSGLSFVSATTSQISMAWNDNSNNETGFEIERAPSGGSFAFHDNVGANVTSYTDSGLPASTGYDYRLRATGSVGNSGYSNTLSASTTAPAPPAAPSNLQASMISTSEIELTWNDNSNNEDAFNILRDSGGGFAEIASVGANITSYSDQTVSDGNTYTYKVEAENGDGTALSNEDTVTVELPDFAYTVSESTQEGSKSGDHTDTQQPAGTEVLTEQTSNGNPRRRRSSVNHTWRIDGVKGGVLVELRIAASASDSGENDSFDFEASLDNQQSWTNVFSLAPGASELLVAPLPGASGTVYVRVTDGDNSQGNGALDSLSVTEIVIESMGTIIPEPPANLTANATSSTNISLTWDSGLGQDKYIVEEETPFNSASYNSIGETTTTNFNHAVGAGSSHRYQVCGVDNLSVVIGCTNMAEATTPAASLNLSANGYKQKGLQKADLTWSGADPVDVYRNGSLVIAGASGGAVTDNINNKGGGSYDYQVCEAGAQSFCSNVVTVNF